MPEQFESDDISARRHRIFSELVRADRAALGIFIAVVLLAIAIVFAADNAQQHAAESTAAKAVAQHELWRAQLAQARAMRQSVAMGRRVEAWKAVTNAAGFKRDLELRNEAIAALATPDIRQLNLPRAFVPFQQSLAFDATGGRYLERSADGIVQLRRTSDNEVIWTMPSANKAWYGGGFSRGGRWFVALFADGTITIWDLMTFKKAREFLPNQILSYSISGDDRFCSVLSKDKVARLYSMRDWTEVARVDGAAEDDDLTLNEDGSRVALRSMSRPVITLADWQKPTNRIALKLTAPAFTMEWHPSGDLIACANQSPDQRIHIFDARSGEELRALSGHHAQPIQLAFVPGRPWLLSMSWDGTSRLWDTVSGEELVRLPRYGDAAFLNSKNLQFGWCYENNSILELFQILPSSAVRTIPEAVQPTRRQPTACALSFDDEEIATVSADGIRVLSTAGGNVLKFSATADAHDPFFTKDGTVWFASRGRFCRMLATNDTPEIVEGIAGEKFRVSDDGQVIASLTAGKLFVRGPEGVRSWDTRQEQVEMIALSPNGRWIATGTRTHVGLRVWDAASGELKWSKDLRQGTGVTFAPDSRGLFTATSEGCALWETESGQLIWEKPRASDSVMGIRNAVSPDGKLMAVANTWTEAMLIDPATGGELARLKSPNPRYISAIAFSGNGKYVALTYEDRSIQLWDLAQLRAELGSVGLDWGPRSSRLEPTATPISTSQRGLLMLAAAGVLAAIVFGIGNYNRHRRLLRGYLDIEAVAVARQEQLRGAEKELARVQKMTALGTLAAGVAHDFNNLLSVIRMANTGIARTTRRAPEIADDLQDIEAAVVDGKRIVQSMLGYTRDGVGPAEKFAIAALLEETTRLLSRQFLSGLQVHLEVEPGLPEVIGYPGRLKQMLLNLVVNASEAMNGKGQLWIKATAVGELNRPVILRPSDGENYICISVRDSGPGMDRETRSRIFEPFFTTKTSATTRGTGLGLSLVYTMAEQDGLGLDCQSTPGDGATFTIYFPARSRAGSRSPTSADAAQRQN